MSQATTDERFRRLADETDGMSISAGARPSHVRAAAEATLDLSDVPEADRPALLADLRERVRLAAFKAKGRAGVVGTN